MKIKAKNAKYGVTKRFNIEDSKQKRQIRVLELRKLHMEKHYEGSNILLLESGVYSKSLQIWIAFFPIYVYGGLTFLKILKIYGKSHRR